MRRAFAYAEEGIAGAALIVVVLAVVWGVLTRYVTAQPAAWASEVAAIGFAWCVFVGAAAGLKRGQHVAIDLLTAALPGPVQAAVDRFAALVVLAVAGITTWLSAQFTVEAWDNPTAVLRLPSSVLYGAAVLGFGLMTLRAAQRFLGRPWTN